MPYSAFFKLRSAIFVLLLLSFRLADAQIFADPDIDTSTKSGNESEAAVGLDPTNPQRVFVVSNIASGSGLFAGFSTDGGATWDCTDPTDCTIADGDSGDPLPPACCDATVSWDSFGNLFLAYLASSGPTEVAVSTNGGQSFSLLKTFAGSQNQPTITTGPGSTPGSGSVWICFNQGNIFASGATVSGLGMVGAFGATQNTNASGNYGDIAIGPNGQVMIVCQSDTGGQGPTNILVSLDPDGIGGSGFGSATIATTSNVGGFDFIPAQSGRSVDAESGLAWDRTGGAHNGRLYLMYTQETVNENNDMDILLRFSDNNGTSWSAPVRINDDPSSPIRSQFNPKISLDQTTGNLAFVWHDCRNDNGVPGNGSTNAIANDDAEFYGTLSTDGGATFLPNIIIGNGVSNAAAAGNGIDYGDYIGMAFYGGKFHPAWADNSNITGDNPNGTHHQFDIYTSTITFTNGCPVITLAPAVLPHATAGVDYNQSISASGGAGPYTFAVSSGSFPAAVTLDSSGLLSGIPDLDSVGSYNVTVTATDTNTCFGSMPYTFSVDCPAIGISPPTLPNGVVAVSYDQTLTASGGTAPYTWSVSAGSPPPGVTVNATTGHVSGVPTAPGTFNFTVQAQDSVACAGTIDYSIVIDPGVCPVITLSPASLPNGGTGIPYNATITASGGTGPYTFGVTSGTLPAGLALNSTTGDITGTPTGSGTSNFTVTATDGFSCTGSQSYSISMCLFCDDFEDGLLSVDWTYSKPLWTEAGGNLIGTVKGKKVTAIAAPVFATGCSTCTIETTVQLSGGSGARVWLLGWYVDKKNSVELLMKEKADKWILRQRSHGKTVRKAKASLTILPNVFYDVTLSFDGTNFVVTVDGSQLLTALAGAPPSGTVGFRARRTTASFGEIIVN